jgi:threonine aldolase
MKMQVDFRSDTVTKPSKEMMEAMFDAPVGDDVYGEDPTVIALEEYAANLFGMEAGLFCSSGTQTNQIALNVHLKPGGEVICHEESHIYKYEGGGIAKNSGASVRLLRGNLGRITAAEAAQWINPDDIHYPLTQLISLEDTANRGGGAVYDFQEIILLSELAKKNQLPLHLDGARVMNALAVNGINPNVYGSMFDSISICLSKGLGAPVGSVLIGKKEFIQQARRVRKVFGGGMRQAGIIAAGGLFALKNNVERLKEDHAAAKILESTLLTCDWVTSILPVVTNIVVVCLKDQSLRDSYIQKFADHGIKVSAFGPGMIRFVTHLDIQQDQLEYAVETIKKC